ncbi:TPA: lipoprotein [Klebsiella pneumoniae]|nr:lipoprotein [Klebsiella pneumoniae]
MRKPLIALSITLLVAGCSTLKTDQAIPLLQAETAKMLGLGSSDEITVTNVNCAQPDALGGQNAFTYQQHGFNESQVTLTPFIHRNTLSSV